MRKPTRRHGQTARRFPHRARRGAAALDYVLVLGVVLPLAAFIMGIAPRIMKTVYEMVCALVAWPF